MASMEEESWRRDARQEMVVSSFSLSSITRGRLCVNARFYPFTSNYKALAMASITPSAELSQYRPAENT
jgi:hypothetical protein